MADRPLSIDIRHPLMLKANDLVLLTREDGEIPQLIPGFGLFYRDTCYLAFYALRLHGTAPLLLMSSDGEGIAAQMNLTNSHLSTAKGRVIADHKLSLRRTFLVLADGPVFIDTISVRNFSTDNVTLPLSLEFATTFESMFVLRGSPVGKRGQLQIPRWDGTALRFAYHGADDILRTLLVEFSLTPVLAPKTTEQGIAHFQLDLAPMATEELMVTCRVDERPVGSETLLSAGAPRSVSAMRAAQATASAALLDGYAGIETASQGLGEVLARSLTDIALLEVRRGELANLHEVSQTPSYASVDATLLFLERVEKAIGGHVISLGVEELGGIPQYYIQSVIGLHLRASIMNPNSGELSSPQSIG